MTQPLALVTGGAQRLGKAFALALARMGYAIGLHYLNSAHEADWTKKEIEALGVPAYLLRADLSKPERIARLFDIVREFNEPLKVLVNSAAVMPVGNPRELSLENWDVALDLNLRAPFLMAQEAVKLMPEGGLIVNVSDVGASKAWSRYSSYVVSKSGLETLTKVLARSLAPSIRVNAIAPGFVLKSDVVTPEEWDRLIERLPLKRPARPEEIASALEFLVKNEYVTGQTIVVDGGYSLV
ncbi:MAG: SDR family oxidoreductase [Chloroflexi bacterium]|nr:SDR family oxidoreductase [Chloroflexota bacterium]